MFLLKYICFTIFFYSIHTCKDKNNEDVDWYIIYKLPQNSKDDNIFIRRGDAYIYLTSNNISQGWQLSEISINDSNSMPGLTLQKIYDNADMYVLYNDEPPDKHKNDRKGHTKGVLMSNTSTGFWLIHSVPYFPPEDSYYYPNTGLRFGQSFLCISFDLTNLNLVGIQLKYNEPNIYDAKISDSLKSKLPCIDAIINDNFVENPPWNHVKSLRSVGGENFLSFAKSRNFGKDLYGDWVTTALENDLLVETWLNGPGRLPSNCSKPFSVFNIKKLKLPFEQKAFVSGDDHSKWAIAKFRKDLKYWLCIGDINREEPQKYRGGGTMCLENEEIWTLYNSSVIDFEKCKLSKHKRT